MTFSDILLQDKKVYHMLKQVYHMLKHERMFNLGVRRIVALQTHHFPRPASVSRTTQRA